MPKPSTSDADFIAMIQRYGPAETARRLNVNQRNVFARRATLERKLGIQIKAPEYQGTNTRRAEDHPQRILMDVENGEVLIGSDFHLWPGNRSTAFRAFVRYCKERQPKGIIANGDVLDFPKISSHPPIGWENHPTVADEIEHGQRCLAEIEDAAPKTQKTWNLGNHDGRFETRLATVAPEYARLNGFHLRDYFPAWLPAWSTWINDDVVVTHRYKGGIGATRANALNSGKTMVTGHLHSAKVTPLTDYNGTRYGVDTGCIADPDERAFVDYTEDNPKDWRSGFAVLTFRKGKLLQPELVLVWDKDHVQFRGEIIRV